MAVHLRQKTSPQHLQWCRLLMRVNSDAHAGLAHAGASASGTQWDRSTRRGPMASRTRSTTSARREGTRARGRRRGAGGRVRLGCWVVRGVERRVRRGRERRRRRRGVARDHAGVVVRYATGVRANLRHARHAARARGGDGGRHAPRGWKRAREGPSRGWKCLRATLAPPPRTARLPRRSPPPAVAASQTEKSNHPCWTTRPA